MKKYIFIWKNGFLRPQAYKAYWECLNYETFKGNEKLKLSFSKLYDLVEYAYVHCPFYRKYYDSKSFHPSMLQSEEDWKKVPVLEKWMIRQNVEMMFSDIANRSRFLPSKTGGSTGKPLVVYKSKDIHFEVLAWRALGWYGVAPWMNEAIVHRRVPTTFLQKLKNRVIWWPTQRAYLNATRISEEDLKRFVNELKQKRIKWIVGYCGSLEYIADYIIHHNIQIEEVKLVWSTSSPLTKIVREKLEKAFDCPIMDQYGCCEMGNIAIQKPNEDYLTVNSDYVHVDIVDGDVDVTNEHKLGDVCITDLNTLEFPLIKYRLGDRSRMLKTMEESEDGFPKLAFVQGRISDMIYLPDNTCLDGSYLTTICDNHSEHISCYQIHQQKDYNIIFTVIPKNATEQTIHVIQNITHSLENLVKNQVKIELRIVDKIEDFAGKRKFIISEIALSKL